MTEIELLKQEIKMLQSKLALLEEMENHKSPVEEAYKRWWGDYPPTTPSVSNYEDERWSAFQKGYTSAQEDWKVGEYQPTSQETQMTLENEGEFSIVSYNGETYYRNLYGGICGGWYKTDTDGEVFYLVEDETERKLEKLYQEQVVVEQEPEENEWKTVALRFGEKLSAIGPCGYYDFSPGEWVEWALNAYEKTADDYLRLLKKEPEKEQKWDVVRESVKWCEEHREESVEDYLKPHTPEKTEQLLREAFQKVQQTEEWKETQRKIDSNYDELVESDVSENKQKPKTLYDILYRWWMDIFCNPIYRDWDMETSIEDLVDRIEFWNMRIEK